MYSMCGVRILYQSLILLLGTAIQALEETTMAAHVGDTIILDCPTNPGPFLVGWKTGTPNPETLIGMNVSTGFVTTVNVTDYQGRIIMLSDYSLTISDIRIKDERKFTCFSVNGVILHEETISVRVFKTPLAVHLTQAASFLDEGKMQQVGTCIVSRSYPKPDITWEMNNEMIDTGNPAVNIDMEDEKDEDGYFKILSTLKYLSQRGEKDISFKCRVNYFESPTEKAFKVSETAFVKIHYNTSKITMKLSSRSKNGIKEGDRITLSCSGDGYPAPELFIFRKNGVLQNSGKNGLTLAIVNRNDTGEYECSVSSDPSLMDVKNITVHYVDLAISPSGVIKKKLGENITVNCNVVSSGEVSVTLTNPDKKDYPLPYTVGSLTFDHSGIYICQAKMGALPGSKIKKSMDLQVEGTPHITRLTKKVMKNSKQITCGVEGLPKPTIKWNINGTIEEEGGKVLTLHKLTFKPVENMTITCTAENSYGQDERDLNVTSMMYKEDEKNLEKSDEDGKDKKIKSNEQAKVIVGVIVGLLIAAIITGVAYWFSKKRTLKSNESGTAEEIKKIHTDDNNHMPGAMAM